jgi:hypothetical protein
MHIPTDLGVNLKPDEDTPAVESFIPQTCTHTWVSLTTTIKLGAVLTLHQYHTDRTHEGRVSHPAVPEEWSSSVECQYGYQDQGKPMRTDLSDSTDLTRCHLALGCISRRKRLANIYGTHQSCQGHLLQQRWYQILICSLRSTDQVVGYRDRSVAQSCCCYFRYSNPLCSFDRPMHTSILERKDPPLCQI